jgi:glycosyltransferase involved in cell wall biosynthesis
MIASGCFGGDRLAPLPESVTNNAAPLRVLMLSKACIVGIYQRKLEEIAALGIDLLTLVPPSWKDERGEMLLERVYTDGYRLETLPIRRNGDFHLHSYVGLGQRMEDFKPHIVHIDEEPYNAATWQALYHAERVGARSLFFSWQNIERRYPPPFSWGERWVLNTVDYALVGTQSAGDVWRAKGYTKPLKVIPQFGIDAELFKPREPITPSESRPFRIGYFGRLVEEKGVHVLLDASSQLEFNWQLGFIGGGPMRSALERQAVDLGIRDRTVFIDQVPSTDMPAQYHEIDVLVLPSFTRPNWKEQFGRVLIEAMASGVPVIGSDSGAIPDVISDAGLIFPEGDIAALRACLHRLHSDHALYTALSQMGRAQVQGNFTHAQIAAQTVEVYRQIAATSLRLPARSK